MRRLLLLLGMLPAFAAMGQSPDPVWQDSLQGYWDRINAEYRDTAHTPLRPEDREHRGPANEATSGEGFGV